MTGSGNETESIENQAMEKRMKNQHQRVQGGKSDARKYTETHTSRQITVTLTHLSHLWWRWHLRRQITGRKVLGKEMDSLKENKTCNLINGMVKKAVDIKWLHARKTEGIYKARLVVKRFQQRGEIENTYAPILKLETLKILLSYCWKPYENDIDRIIFGIFLISGCLFMQHEMYNAASSENTLEG